MKVLIWVACIALYGGLTTALQMNGILLGGIPTFLLFGGTMWLAKTVSKFWSESREEKRVKKEGELNYIATHNQIRFCRKCGKELFMGSCICGKCGCEVVEVSNDTQ